MKDPDSDTTTEPPPAGTSADNPEPEPARPSAIERQIAAIFGTGHTEAPADDPRLHAADVIARQRRLEEKSRPSSLPGVGRYLALILLVGAGAALVFSEIGRPVRNYAGAVLSSVQQLSAKQQSPERAIAVVPPAPAAAQPAAPNITPAVAPAVVEVPVPASSAPTNAAPTIPVAVNPGALSVSIADVSLRKRPELLEQLVQVYRSQLASNPSDPAALAALNQLQAQSFFELETIVAEKDDQASAKSLAIVSRLFPEQAEKLRYKFALVQHRQELRDREQRDQEQREAKADPPVSSAPRTAQNTAQNVAPPISAVPAATKSITQPAISPKNISASSTAALATAQKSAADIAPSKPQINVLSVTPGAMVGQRFLPTNHGTAFMVEINYRNFLHAEDQPDATLTVLLGAPGDSTVLAEAPVEISGERGTKSFLMESLVAGDSGERYRLNFILNGKLLTSSTVRLQ